MNNPSSLPRYARELDAALSIATWLIVAVMFGTLFAAVAYFVLPPPPEPFSMSVNFPISQPAPWPVDSAERNGKLVYREATLNLPAANFPVFFRMAMPLNAILLPSLALVAILKLRAVVRTVRESQPFIPENYRRLRTFGWLIIALGIWTSVLQTTSSIFALSTTNLVIAQISLGTQTINFGTLFTGLGVLVMAEVFRMGIEIKAEQSLTV